MSTATTHVSTVRTLAPPATVDVDAFGDQPAGADAFRPLAEQLADPCVITEYRPGSCSTARTESFGGPMGPLPVEVAKTILRCLDRRPEAVLCDPDPAGVPNRAYVTDGQGAPLARVTGLTPDQFNDALLSLAVGGWEPGRNREVVRPMTAIAADRMPAGRVGPGGPERPTTAPHQPARQSRFL
ncbi:hypothetical protein [Brevundimonas subvibrioides]|uniref:Uncharacterized protein n=1 Tax=Brevundimonas subvibrioides (strain ATCC 15264 / DSM 4735 / LMG 14903 / NBRC 16000 / CB 81) TaxID=633149 RepID=D9QFW0_BRESC|nr:hypothetical protein [Brevundimonas subvibrioides]ADL00674.1 hypothetical protein Bresu_1362 [Brevundimonas subvibrioides ATCC 15264]